MRLFITEAELQELQRKSWVEGFNFGLSAAEELLTSQQATIAADKKPGDDPVVTMCLTTAHNFIDMVRNSITKLKRST